MSEKQLLDWNNEPIAVPGPLGPPSVNPCVTKFGVGPEGRKCGECIHLHGFKQSTTWYKCDMRQWKAKAGKMKGTIFPGGDHRTRWPACAKYEDRTRDTQMLNG